MNSKRNWIIAAVFVIWTVLLLGVGLTGGIVVNRQFLADTGATPADQLDFNLITEAWNLIQKEYVDRQAINSQQLTYGAISGMVQALGDTGHTTFLTPDMVRQEQTYIQGELEGIGAEVQMKDGRIVIVAPLDGSPAEKAGLRPGDVILKVNSEDVTGQSLGDVVDKILGPAGTQVTLTILNPKTGETRQVTITRAKIELKSVTWQMLPGTKVAHVRIARFSQGTTDELRQALQEIKAQGATGLVLDLRNDPGGLLSEAIGVTSQFINSGNVLLEKDAQGKITEVPVKSGGEALDIPMVVLVNQGTASAAEIVSGALKDANRAKIVGETTFGTGTVLQEFKLSDGSALMLATQEWLTPSGKTIWHQGIEPQVTVELPTDQEALTPEAEKSMTPNQLQSSGDTQLLKALQLLQSKA
jgi:carboxyl-terminal processing protease